MRVSLAFLFPSRHALVFLLLYGFLASNLAEQFPQFLAGFILLKLALFQQLALAIYTQACIGLVGILAGYAVAFL
jgi:hypothetical protein